MAARLLRRLSHLPNEVDDYSCLNIAPCLVQFISVYSAKIHYEIRHKKKLLHGKGAQKKP